MTDATYTQQTRRLMAILAYAKAHPGASGPDMAAAAGVSKATFHRMLDVLANAFGAIIESRGGHYYVASAGLIKISKAPCLHEFYEDICARCELTGAEYRASHRRRACIR